MRGYLVHFTWDWVGHWYGLCHVDAEQESCFWVPISAYSEHQLASLIARLTGESTWVKTDEGEYPIIEKRRIRVFSYRVEAVELC